MEIVVHTHQLTKHFGDFTAVDQVSFEIRQGEVVGYLGPNGSGKTTTIRMLLGLLLPSEGEAQVLGHDVLREAEAIRSEVGYMSQKSALYDELTVWENLAFYAGVYGVREKKRLLATLDRVSLGKMRHIRAGELPVGLRQRLALGTAIVHRPPLLFLDEPTSGVDPVSRRDFWDLLYELVEEGVTTLVTTHYMDEAEYCHRVGILREGRLLAMDTPSSLKESALPGIAWDVYAQPLLPALVALERLPNVSQAGLSGEHLRAITDCHVTARQLEQELANSGFTVVHIEQTEPNLKDVFIALAG